MDRITLKIGSPPSYTDRVSLDLPIVNPKLQSPPPSDSLDSFDPNQVDTIPASKLDSPLSSFRTRSGKFLFEPDIQKTPSATSSCKELDSPIAKSEKKLEDSPLSLESNSGLKALENQISKVTNCRSVGLEDSTTGAHVAMDENGNSIFIVKSNNECYFEFLGNYIAEMLHLNIPDFALLGADINQQPRLKSMLRTQNEFPCMITEFRCAINLKEVSPGSLLDTDMLFHQLGRVFLMDLVIGNWDRFPVFENDMRGNYGNVMYEPELQQLLFIDTVAQKHTESGGYGTNHYLDLLDERLASACIKIKSWLESRFPSLESLDNTELINEFKAGVDDALKILIDNEKELTDLFSFQQHQIEDSYTKTTEKLSYTADVLDQTVPAHLEQLRRQTTANSPANLQDVLLAITRDEYFTDKEKTELSNRLSKGRGIPRIGNIAAKVNSNKSFMTTWNIYSANSHQLESIERLEKINILLKNKNSELDPEVLINGLKSTAFNDPALKTFIHLYEMKNELQMQRHKLMSLIDVFKKLIQRPNTLRAQPPSSNLEQRSTN